MENKQINRTDGITLQRIELIHPKLVGELKQIYAEIVKALTGKAICRFAYTLRTFSEQTKLFAKGRTAPGSKVTNAKAGQSFHNYGLAVDIVLLIDKDGNGTFEEASWDTAKDFDADTISDWKEIVHIFKMHGWEWGGDWNFKDLPHFQKTMGYNIKQLQFLYQQKKFISGSIYLAL